MIDVQSPQKEETVSILSLNLYHRTKRRIHTKESNVLPMLP